MNEFDYIIVGSGFGGSVAALRLAQKGYKVAVLEAGKRWRPEDFPKSTWDARRYCWLPRLGCHGIQRLSILRHALVFSGAGVGGGSLVYGNTLFTPLDSFFEEPLIAEMGGKKALLPYYELARKMLGVVPNPRLFQPDQWIRETAEEFGRADTFTPSPVAVYFGDPLGRPTDPYFDGEGPARSACNFCGGCFVGCRKDAKNTLDKNYLYFAEKLGARIIPETEVTGIRPLTEDGSGGYEVRTRRSTSLGGAPARSFTTQGVVVSAGVLGTLKLLLNQRRRGHLPRLSPALGRGVRTNSETIVGVTDRDRSADHSTGIAASSSVFPDPNTQIQVDRYPAGSDTLALLATLMVDGGGGVPRALRFLGEILRHPVDFLRTLSPFGYARRSIILVVMQNLENSLRISLKRRWFWPFSPALRSSSDGGEIAPSFIPIGNDFARRLAKRMNGMPFSTINEVLFDIPVTAHILGGCPASSDPAKGVIDLRNRVHGYRNFYVCDGSMVTTNLGVNPALSITALTERAMALVAPKGGARAEIRHLAVERKWAVTDVLKGPACTG